MTLACDAAGNCACSVDSDCGTPTACTSFTCNTATSVCATVYTDKGQGNPGGGTTGNCMKVTCDEQGGPLQVVDDTNIDDDGNFCTTDVCTNGVSSHPATVAGSSCGGLLCDGAGKCVCTMDAECGAPFGLRRAYLPGEHLCRQQLGDGHQLHGRREPMHDRHLQRHGDVQPPCRGHGGVLRLGPGVQR